MTIQQSIARLSYTVSKGHKPNETDKIALNKVIHDLNANAKENVQDNILFAKLYALVLTDFIRHYQDNDFANKQINKELSFPIGVHLENLKKQLNDTEIQNFFKSKGITDPYLTTPKHWHGVNEVLKRNAELFPQINGAEFLEVSETWDIENVTAHFTNSVNQSILCLNK
jgi:hypothetical protein